MPADLLISNCRLLDSPDGKDGKNIAIKSGIIFKITSSKVTFKSGQKVRIIGGRFNEFIGIVDDIDMERAKVHVMVSFFGRETPVEMAFLQVENA